ncbi:MAG: group 1 glycosyl transferase [Parcubacteria group bacterium Gr01-1014_8]|nr:MAG: group 1 glycosyl transferase [Parcubacteria group bacterium Gr01-1014_8]
MNIVYITSARIPSERAYGYAITKLCEEWGKAGHDVRLILPEREHGLQDDLFEYYKLERTFTIEKISASDWIGKSLSTSRVHFALDLLAFVISLRTVRFDADTAIYTREYLLALTLPARNLFLEVHTVHSKGFLFRRALGRVRGIVAISEGVKKELVALGVAEEKIKVAHDGVDLDPFAQAPADRSVWRQFGVEPSQNVVLYAGHFYEWKGADTLAVAGKMLPSDVHTVLVGGVDNELRDFREKYAASNVHIAPHRSRATIPVLLKSADVLVLPNSAKAEISRSHASPLKLFEYMAAGVAIVASDVPSLREVLSEDTAFFFKADDSNSLAEVIGRVLKLPDDAHSRAEQAKKKADTYTWRGRAADIAQFLDRLGSKG